MLTCRSILGFDEEDNIGPCLRMIIVIGWKLKELGPETRVVTRLSIVCVSETPRHMSQGSVRE